MTTPGKSARLKKKNLKGSVKAMEIHYTPKGVCSRQIDIVVEDLSLIHI